MGYSTLKLGWLTSTCFNTQNWIVLIIFNIVTLYYWYIWTCTCILVGMYWQFIDLNLSSLQNVLFVDTFFHIWNVLYITMIRSASEEKMGECDDHWQILLGLSSKGQYQWLPNPERHYKSHRYHSQVSQSVTLDFRSVSIRTSRRVSSPEVTQIVILTHC